MPGLPAGTVTFLFTDIEGSTTYPGGPPGDLPGGRAAPPRPPAGGGRGARGFVFETVGDAVYAAFDHPTDAAGAALQGS